MDNAQKTMAQTEDGFHSGCIACGSRNNHGMHLRFETQNDGSVTTCFKCQEKFEGYTGRLHGGIVSMLLDSAMTHCMFAKGLPAVTAELNIRYYQPVLTGKTASVKATIIKSAHKLYLLEAELVQDEEVKASARAKFMEKNGFSSDRNGTS